MDYFSQSITFKIRKVLRYIKLYGPARTWIKVQGQRHKKKQFTTLPPVNTPTENQPIGVIGCGNYAFSNISYYLTSTFGTVIGACMDKSLQRAASLAAEYKVPHYADSVDDMMAMDSIRMVYIASNHATHAEYAIQAMNAGKDVYIEKPHVVSEDQLERLIDTMHETGRRVFLGFNRPDSKLGKLMRNAIDQQPGAGVYNWFVAGHEIDPDHWYFHPAEGGRILGNLCHWTDFLFTLVAPEKRFPIHITPTRDEKSDSDIAVTYRFGDGTIGCITFSAKGHTFEGVKERFSGHRGNLLIALEDFQRLTLEVVEKKKTHHNWFRDHGHGDNITRAYRNVFENEEYDHEQRMWHIANTASLFLNTRTALEENRTVTIEPYDLPIESTTVPFPRVA